MKFNHFFLLSLSLIISGCSSVPKSLQVAEETVLTKYNEVSNTATTSNEQIARWGGVIAKVTNNAENTLLEIVHMPLSSSSRPKNTDDSTGRFRVYYKGLLDPMIFKPGRSVTALGSIAKPESGTIGEHKYVFPVIKAKTVHLWKDIKQVEVQIQPFPIWTSPYYTHPRYHPRPIIIKKTNTTNAPKTKAKKLN